MNINKMNFIKLMSVVLLVSFSSCQVTDLTPQNSLSPSTAFTADRIALSVVGVYDAANSGTYAGGAVRGYPFGAAHVEQGDVRGEDVVNTQAFYLITYQSSYDPTSANNDWFFQNCYLLINRANVVIEGIKTIQPTATVTQAVLNHYEAECRFLRALANHYLLVFFARPYSDNPTAANGGIPIVTTPATSGTTVDLIAKQGRNTVAEGYDQIIQDLDFAEANLFPNTDPFWTSAGMKITRATKAAAVALKTRVYLHKGDLANVVTEGNKLAPQSGNPFSPNSAYGTYSLTANPYGPFGAGNKSNTESVFSIENSTADNPGVNGALPTMYTPSAQNGRGLVGVSPVLYNQSWFMTDDIRKSSTFLQADPGASGKNAMMSKKYTDISGRSDNAPVIRYAEVLLNMAEAIQRQTGSVDPRALALLNAVRNRSVTNAAEQFNIASFATANDLITAVLRERRIEFVCEGLRWLDIHRLAQDPNFSQGGIPAKISNSITNYGPLYTSNPATAFTMLTGFPYSDRRFVWPIPASETSINPILAAQQNPGY